MRVIAALTCRLPNSVGTKGDFRHSGLRSSTPTIVSDLMYDFLLAFYSDIRSNETVVEL